MCIAMGENDFSKSKIHKICYSSVRQWIAYLMSEITKTGSDTENVIMLN